MHKIWGFPKIRGTSLEVPIIRIVVFRRISRGMARALKGVLSKTSRPGYSCSQRFSAYITSENHPMRIAFWGGST